MAVCTLPDQLQIHYEILDGRAGRPWLIFLHEGLGSIGQWQDFPERLCQRTSCPGLVYDRQGYGGSSPLTEPRALDYLHKYAQIELPQLLAAVLPGRPYVLIGHSDGGSISLIHGAEKPAGLKGIITEAAHVLVEPETLAGIEQAVAAHQQGHLRGLARYHGEKAEAVFSAWADTWLSPPFAAWNIEYLLPAIEVPLLVLQGMADQYGSQAQVDSIVSRSSGQATPLMLEDCGHTPHKDMPALVLDLMSCFVNRVGR